MSGQLLAQAFPLKPLWNIKASEMHPSLQITHLPLRKFVFLDNFLWKPFSPKKIHPADSGPQLEGDMA